MHLQSWPHWCTDIVIGQLFVSQSKSKDLLHGVAKEVWKCLEEHNTPKDGMALQLVKQELMNCYQKECESSTDYIS
jgi:hypothetical protein